MVFLATGRILYLIDVLCTTNPSHLSYQRHDFTSLSDPRLSAMLWEEREV